MILLLITVWIFGCSDDDNGTNQETSIYGTWQLVEFFSHPPTGNGWEEVENGFMIELKADGDFVSNEFDECQTGIFNTSNSVISLVYDCEEFTAGYEEPEGTFSYDYRIENSTLELRPANFSCFEGCSYRLRKVGNP